MKCIFALPLDWVKTKDKETLSIIVQIFERNRLFVIQQDWALGLFKGRDLTRRGRQSPLAVVKAKWIPVNTNSVADLWNKRLANFWISRLQCQYFVETWLHQTVEMWKERTQISGSVWNLLTVIIWYEDMACRQYRPIRIHYRHQEWLRIRSIKHISKYDL